MNTGFEAIAAQATAQTPERPLRVGPTNAPLGPVQDAALRQAAEAFESVFISEMLKHTGIADATGPFSAGFGEETFRHLLIREYSNEISAAGGFGLADKIYEELRGKVAPYVE